MRFSQPAEPVEADDDAIRDALTHARVVPLLAAVAYATGDLSVLRDELRPDPARLVEPDGGVDGERAGLARELALEALVRFRDGGSVPAPVPGDEALRRILGFMVGDHMVDDYLPLFLEELSVHGDDRRAPDWTLDELAPGTPFRVAIIGAGTSAEWSEESGSWTLCLRTPDGEETLEAQAVVSAVGQLNRPSFPAIPGRETFEGVSFHSARWRHDVDLAGKRVAVIGTGASAVQFAPEIAPDVDELLVFQRTPPWMVPTENYHEEVSDQMRWLFRHVPTYTHWYRFWLFWQNAEGMLPAARVDPDWEGEGSVGLLNDLVRQLLTAYITNEFASSPELIDQVLPTYPPIAKRVVRDNGTWPRALQRDNVSLITAGIDQISATGITTVDGVSHDVDVIIYGTGFTASRFLTPMKVVGRGGVDLHEQWDGDARAYLGLLVPGFPNLFLLYGPNTNIVINGSIIYFSECEVHYLIGCLKMLLAGGHRALDVRPEVHDAYNVRIDEGNRNMVWGVSTVNTWYKNAKGRITQNWPFSLLDYWRETREPDPADFEVL